MPALRYDPEFLRLLEAARPAKREPFKDVYELRATNDAHMAEAMGRLRGPPNVVEDVFTIKSYDDVEIEITRYTPSDTTGSDKALPAILYIHGGGTVFGSVKIWGPQTAAVAANTGYPIFAVEYRLAPEHPAPCAVEDCYAALTYLSEHAARYRVDPARIIVMGDSAGAGIAAGLTLMARDRALNPPVAKQVLIYPMLDDATELPEDSPKNQLVTWSSWNNKLAWGAYVGEDKRGKPDADVSPYAAPARAKSLRGLPATYMDVGTLDLFCNEDIAYAARLAQDDVEIEFHLWPGLPHGFEGFSELSWTKAANDLRMKALKRVAEI
ncbi:Alpha/Beta hydrolase protein [Stachybotrys elegans]|uniref:Alpha/Beta hydrolase protein n=1 Tax=Stachybotrys elegans TaxID=80388 RepID=A0A8K0WUD0_9HYPO|nr:Alpha/Beta hydrolase protein [Stachybotrys elegans]